MSYFEQGKIIETYSTDEVVEIMGTDEQTVRKWCKKGKYPEAYQTNSGDWHIPKKYFKISLKQARRRNAFEEKLNLINQMKREVTEDEFL
ncbi:helix-turn-helix domain-containing protein [Caldifermentibacillus hisashii]|uniref:helix-turn-helix domain-containing protein n=1 Tax=Caldifermentibacillus hisashii TaxID=996558 RepID=UPI00342BAABC